MQENTENTDKIDTDKMNRSAIKEGDFVEIEYTGRVMEGGFVFDTTSADIAKSNNVFDQSAIYGPVIVCIGAGHLLKGLERELAGKGLGQYRIPVQPENGFGKKNAKLLQMVPAAKFRSQDIEPVPGLQVNIDGIFGIVKTVSGGRAVIDFNHPLAGKELDYEVEVRRLVTDTSEKLNAMLKFYFREFSASASDGKASIELKSEIPEQLKGKLSEEVKRLIPEVKEVEFRVQESKG